jgi:hypothetical protein
VPSGVGVRIPPPAPPPARDVIRKSAGQAPAAPAIRGHEPPFGHTLVTSHLFDSPRNRHSHRSTPAGSTRAGRHRGRQACVSPPALPCRDPVIPTTGVALLDTDPVQGLIRMTRPPNRCPPPRRHRTRPVAHGQTRGGGFVATMLQTSTTRVFTAIKMTRSVLQVHAHLLSKVRANCGSGSR